MRRLHEHFLESGIYISNECHKNLLIAAFSYIFSAMTPILSKEINVDAAVKEDKRNRVLLCAEAIICFYKCLTKTSNSNFMQKGYRNICAKRIVPDFLPKSVELPGLRRSSGKDLPLMFSMSTKLAALLIETEIRIQRYARFKATNSKSITIWYRFVSHKR